MRTLNDALSYTRPPTTLDLHVAFLPSSSHPAPYSATTALVRLLSQVAYPLSAGTPVRLIFENPEPRADRHPSEQADGAGFEGEIAGTRGTIQGVEELVARNTKPQARFRRAIIRLPTLPSAPAHSDIAPELFQRLLEISVERLNDARHTGRRPNNYFQARPDEELRRWDLAYLRPQLGTFQPELSGPRTESCDQREEQPAVGTESSRDQSANALPPIHAWWTPPTTTGTAVNAAVGNTATRQSAQFTSPDAVAHMMHHGYRAPSAPGGLLPRVDPARERLCPPTPPWGAPPRRPTQLMLRNVPCPRPHLRYDGRCEL